MNPNTLGYFEFDAYLLFFASSKNIKRDGMNLFDKKEIR